MEEKVLLEKCPFCGGEAKVITDDSDDWNDYCVLCKDCGVRTPFTGSKKDAIEKWNSCSKGKRRV